MDFTQINWAVVALAIPFLLMVVFFFWIFVRFGGLWLQAFTSGVQVMLIDMIGMEFRRTDVRAVVRAMIMAKQSGINLSRSEVEKAYLQGVDLPKITLALIQAKKQDLGLNFEQLVDADLEGKLQEKMKDS